MKLDYASGMKLELVEAVSDPENTFNSLSTVPLDDLLSDSWPNTPEWYSYKTLFKFTTHDSEGVEKIYLWSGYKEDFKIRVEEEEGVTSFYLHLIAQALLQRSEISTVVVDLIETEATTEGRLVSDWGWRLFAYLVCVGKTPTRTLLLATRTDDPNEVPETSEGVVEFLAERVSGYDVLHSMTVSEYEELNRKVFGPSRKPYEAWEAFLPEAIGDRIVVVDKYYPERSDVVTTL